jgi:hypothetical protein
MDLRKEAISQALGVLGAPNEYGFTQTEAGQAAQQRYGLAGKVGAAATCSGALSFLPSL